MKKVLALVLVLCMVFALCACGASNSKKLTMGTGGEASSVEMTLLYESLKFAVIVVSTLPILVLYPFVKKYFVKGVMIGAVKG